MHLFYHHIDADQFDIDWETVYNTVSYATVASGFCPHPEESHDIKTLYDCTGFIAEHTTFDTEWAPHWSQVMFLAGLSTALIGPPKKPILYFSNKVGNMLYIEFEPGQPIFRFGTSLRQASAEDLACAPQKDFWKMEVYDLSKAEIFS